ncbi:alpha-L-arabinofuranosidase C-terminal domain-containing protein, partial [Mesorhizobium sp. ArgA1]
AHETAKAMRAFSQSLELVVCGSSNAKMATYPEWEAVVLDHTYNEVDYISLHMYFDNEANDAANYLAMNEKLDAYIVSVAGVIDYIKAKKRSSRQVYISFDEWNVWYHSKQQDKKILGGNDGWPFAPPLLEDIYNFEDVLQVGLILNTFIRRSDVVKIACLAQLVNVIAPIMTVPNGPAWRQTIFYPYLFASIYGRGNALDLKVESPTYKSSVAGDVSCVDITGVHNTQTGHVTFFAVNRHSSEAIDTLIDLTGFGQAGIVDHQVMTHADLKAVNSAGNPGNVGPRKGEGASMAGGTLSLSLPAYSYQMIRLML